MGSLSLSYWWPTRSLLLKHNVNITELSLRLNSYIRPDHEFVDFISAMQVLGPSVQHLFVNCEESIDKWPLAGISVVKGAFFNLKSVKFTAMDEATSIWVMENTKDERWSCTESLRRIHFDRCTLPFTPLTQFIHDMTSLDQIIVKECIPCDMVADDAVQLILPKSRLFRMVDISCRNSHIRVVTDSERS
jgi:hypothetical protein